MKLFVSALGFVGAGQSFSSCFEGGFFAGFEGIDHTVGFFDLAAAFGDNLLAQAIVAPFVVDIVQ